MLTVNSNPSGTAVLFDPVQSSTHCDVGCEASIGIDGDSDTNSRTLYGNGSHWWQVRNNLSRNFSAKLFPSCQ